MILISTKSHWGRPGSLIFSVLLSLRQWNVSLLSRTDLCGPMELFEKKMSLWLREQGIFFLKLFSDIQQIWALTFWRWIALITFLRSFKMRIQFSEKVPAKFFHLDMSPAWELESWTLVQAVVTVYRTLKRAANPLASVLTSVKCRDWPRDVLKSLLVSIFWNSMLPRQLRERKEGHRNHVSGTCLFAYK